MSNISSLSQCANCGACYNSCPTGAIRVDGEGLFYRVAVDREKCANCGKCLQICPVNSPEMHQNLLSAYYGVNKDHEIVKNSSSGGAFSAIANCILEDGGIVFGACFDDDFRKVVIRSTDEVPLSKLLKSKYVESLVGDSFSHVKYQLSTGRQVLYCGSPCQIVGLKRFLGQEYKNLYTCDFTCGGFPSHEMYRTYIDTLEKRRKSAVTKVDFRPKTLGWETYAIQICFDKGLAYHSPAALDPFFSAFLRKHYSVRESCLNCQFSDNHFSDIILSDFWRYREFAVSEKMPEGISLVITNSDRGEELLERASANFPHGRLDLQKAAYNIKKISFPHDFYGDRNCFLECYQSYGLWKAAKRYCVPPAFKVFVIKVKSVFKYLFWRVK